MVPACPFRLVTGAVHGVPCTVCCAPGDARAGADEGPL